MATAKRRTSQADRDLIKAHNKSLNGLKMGVCKTDRKPNSETPLFKQDNQTKLEF